MDYYSILDHDQNSMSLDSELGPESDVQQRTASPSQHGSVSAAIAAVNAASGGIPGTAPSLHFPGEDGGHSLAAMAQRDLDAALQLLAERAQYITQASGAAIALRRNPRNDMLCRASAGCNAPELGTLLSAEFGLSGESVRTRLALRCDNADRDPRVNREGCRRLGIASVAVVPIVSDDQILGVFELFSGKINAFEERDLSALQRLGEMVEAAIKLTHAAQNLGLEAIPREDIHGEREPSGQPTIEVATEAVSEPVASETTVQQASPTATQPEIADAESSTESSPKRPLLWSAALNPGSAVSQQPADQSHVPPVLRNLHTCQACGFPVSEGRKLCVECEEKQFRGQLRVPPAAASVQRADAVNTDVPEAIPEERSKTEIPVPAPPVPLHADAAVGPALFPQAPGEAPFVTSVASFPALSPIPDPEADILGDESSAVSENSSGPLFLSGVSSSGSWFSGHKYIIGSLVVVAVLIAIIILMR
jgi:hypothetical protein